MNFDLSDLRAFVTVAQLASFRAAAQALHVSQPALSRRVDKLEQALGMRLFERSTRKVELNAMGRSFLPRAQHVLSELEGALLGMTELSERIRGLVTVACIPSAVDNFVARAASLFHARFPRIRLRVLDQPAPDVLLSVSRSDADFGISYLGAREPDLEFEELASEPFVLACRSDHPLARRRRVRWQELADVECIGLAAGGGNRLLIDQGLAHLAARPKWIGEVLHVPALLSLIQAGVGVGAVPKHALSGSAGQGLACVDLVEPVLGRQVGLIWRRGQPPAPAVQAFRDVIVAEARTRQEDRTGGVCLAAADRHREGTP